MTHQSLSRDIIRLEGPETDTLLQGLLTCNVEGQAPGEIRHGALLTPQGKIVDAMLLTKTADALFIDVASGRGDGLLKKLKLYRLRAKVEIEDAGAAYHIAMGEAPPGALVSAPDPRHEGLPTRHLVEGAPENADGDEMVRDELLGLGVPDFGLGFGEADSFPLGVNLDLLNGIDHKKGCFVGQEVASRMFRKGEIRKRTWQVEGEGLSEGQDLKVDGRTVATVTAAQGDLGLAATRVDLVSPATALDVDREDGSTVRLFQPAYFPKVPS